MATTDVLHGTNGHEQAHRRRPFAAWVKKLANFKSSDSERSKRHTRKKRGSKANNPYPQSGNAGQNNEPSPSVDSLASSSRQEDQSLHESIDQCTEQDVPRTAGGCNVLGSSLGEARSITARSHGASSLTGTSRTVGGGLDSRRGEDSTFSSPAPSVRSLTTTLTTIQSLAPNGAGPSTTNANQSSNAQSIQFTQPFPTSQPASAIPAHLAPTANPTTYTLATANGLLTDNASILTLASSSKRRRRRSMDTDASVRAMAPSSLWGGSRESLPLSVLSANVESSGLPTTPGLHGSSSRMGAERNSLYSATGVAPAITSERNSIYAKQGDGASVRSGLLGHNRNDSVGGSNAGLTNALMTPLEVPAEGPDSVEKRAESSSMKKADLAN